MQALLIIGHGTRDPAGLAEFQATVDGVARRLPQCRVQAAFLELARPSLETSLQELAAEGIHDVVAVPLLLFSAGHAKRDIPERIRRVQAITNQDVTATPTLDCHPRLLELSRRRFEQCLHQAPFPAEETALLMVGRGSYDPQANAEMARFARLRFEAAPVGWLEIAFTAMAEPSLDRAVNVLGNLGLNQVIVQPHLLFQGELFERVRTSTIHAAAAYPRVAWGCTENLGPDALLVEAVVAQAVAGNSLPAGGNSAIASPEVCG